MACKITIATGNGNSVEVEVPSLPNSLSELKKILSQNGKLGELKSYIKNTVGQGKIIQNQQLSAIIETGNIIPNTTISTLRERFPDAGFPEGDLDNVKVLFINKYSTTAKELSIGIIEQNGEQIFVIDYNNIRKLANYLVLKKNIEEDDFIKKQSKENKKILELCKIATKHSSIEQMILEYLSNKNSFREYRTSDGKSVFSLLHSILMDFSEYARKKEFSNQTVQEFYLRLENWNKDKKTWDISLEELYSQVLMFDEEIKQVLPDTYSKFKKFISSENTTDSFVQLFGEGNKLENIINYLVSKEPWLALSYEKLIKDRVIVRKQFPNIKRVYDIGFNTIAKMSYSKYRGYYIFSLTKDGNTKYYPSQYYLTENSRSYEYSSLEEAQQSINEQIEIQELADYRFLEINKNGAGRRILDKNIPIGTLLEIKDYEVQYKYISNSKERELIEVGTMKDFYDYLQTIDKSGEIANYIQNAQEAVLFLYKKNEKNKQDLLQLAKEIHKSPVKYFYVEQRYESTYGKKYHRLIEAKDPKLEEFKKGIKTPIISLFNAVSNNFAKKFGIDIQILTNDEIKEKFNVENAKAFIVGDQIILNSTLASSDDVFHEYSHLVLGYLKHKNPQNYRQLLEIVWQNMYSGNRNAILNKYNNLPRESILEEGFVSEFGKYISNNLINNNLQNIFKNQEGFLREGISSIFDGEVNINKIFGSTLQSVFNRFNQEIGYLLNSDNDFLSFIKSDDFFLQRKKTNWLEKQIEQGKIEEIC